MCPQYDSQRRRDIVKSIQKLDADVSFLNQQKQQLLRELKSIPISERPATIPEEISSEEKVKLFQGLFRGRTDVYAKHWLSRKTGKSGYSPVCKNEWAPKICQRGVFSRDLQQKILDFVAKKPRLFSLTGWVKIFDNRIVYLEGPYSDDINIDQDKAFGLIINDLLEIAKKIGK